MSRLLETDAPVSSWTTHCMHNPLMWYILLSDTSFPHDRQLTRSCRHCLMNNHSAHLLPTIRSTYLPLRCILQLLVSPCLVFGSGKIDTLTIDYRKMVWLVLILWADESCTFIWKQEPERGVQISLFYRDLFVISILLAPLKSGT